MKTNLAMRKLFSYLAPTSLEPTLNQIIDRGFEIRDNCYFLTALFPKNTNVTRTSFHDCTGYECFINKIHIEDYDDKSPISQAIQFIFHVFMAWRKFNQILILTSIISISKYDIDGSNVDRLAVVVKFHIKRPTEQWLAEDIEGYEEPIMVIESSEDLTMILATLFPKLNSP